MRKIQGYKDVIEKQASIAAIGGLASKAAGAMTSGVKSFANMGAGKRMLAGSALGGAVKGVTHDDSTGKSRLSSITSGAVGGGMIGSNLNRSNLKAMSTITNDVKGIAKNKMNNILNK